jgi:spore germination cell wall hydrolase CwlJ-like protein
MKKLSVIVLAVYLNILGVLSGASSIDINTVSDQDIVALTLLMEARGEGEEGMKLVATVIFNRAAERKKTLREICLEKYQFSCWNKIENIEYYRKIFRCNVSGKTACRIADNMVLNGIRPINKEYTHYHTTNINPKWSYGKTGNVYGNHIFYSNI